MQCHNKDKIVNRQSFARPNDFLHTKGEGYIISTRHTRRAATTYYFSWSFAAKRKEKKSCEERPSRDAAISTYYFKKSQTSGQLVICFFFT